VVVLGRVSGVARMSKLPLSGEFGHVWTLEDGRAQNVEAYLDSATALRSVGLRPSRREGD
jgi:ketosteroid isomerase-like protein